MQHWPVYGAYFVQVNRKSIASVNIKNNCDLEDIAGKKIFWISHFYIILKESYCFPISSNAVLIGHNTFS